MIDGQLAQLVLVLVLVTSSLLSTDTASADSNQTI
jgi:hypothetical protein